MVSFAVQKLLTLFLFLLPFLLEPDTKLVTNVTNSLLPMLFFFSSGSLNASDLTFKSLIHLELFFVYSER